MKKPVEVKEFQSVICNTDYKDSENYTYIDKKDFDDLISFIYDYTNSEAGADAFDFMRIISKRGVGETVTFNNYVGLIQTKSGFQIEVLPKICFADKDDIGNEATKRIFIKMLRSLKNFPGKVFNDASLKVDRMNLYELFINMYIQEVRQIVKHGLRSTYISKEENIACFKGKLLVNLNMRQNIIHKERFYVSFEEFHQNRPENRIVKATLEKLQRITTSAENSKEIRQLLLSFEMVKSSVSYETDFSKVILDRNTKDYENIIRWSRVFLMNESFTTFSGHTSSRALLFPMESVYESYVAKKMKEVLGQFGWEISSQDRGFYLFEEPEERFALRPDIVLKKGARTVIMDTKWKELFDNSAKNYGISQADMYQMYAYSKKYKTPEVWLLYPDDPEMKGRNDIYFSDNETVVRVRFIDLINIENDLVKFNTELERVSS